jgi:hypothetical protein
MARLEVGSYSTTLTAEVPELSRHDNVRVTMSNGNVVELLVDEERGTVNVSTQSTYGRVKMMLRPIVGNSFDIEFISQED